jgi:hypothetical protein
MSLRVVFQFMMQTAIIIVFGILFLGGIIPEMIFESNLFANVSAETLAHRDALWNWSIVIFIGAIAGNVVWLLREGQKEESEYVDF